METDKFILLFRGKPMEESDAQDMREKWNKWINTLKESGNYIDAYLFHPHGYLLDYPDHQPLAYMQDEDGVGGYMLISAKNMEEAAGIARDFPGFAHGGRVEIRPVIEM